MLVLDNSAFLLFVCVLLSAFMVYHTVGNFCGVQFLQMVDLYHFAGLIFTDARTHTHYVLYN